MTDAEFLQAIGQVLRCVTATEQLNEGREVVAEGTCRVAFGRTPAGLGGIDHVPSQSPVGFGLDHQNPGLTLRDHHAAGEAELGGVVGDGTREADDRPDPGRQQ